MHYISERDEDCMSVSTVGNNNDYYGGCYYMIQCWFLAPYGMMEAIFCGHRYEVVAEGIEPRCELYKYVNGWWNNAY